MSRLFLKSSRPALAACVAALALAFSGCGGGADRPELGEVSGTVTIDGKPLVGSIVLFKPDNGRAGSATTDKDGKYTLIYRQGVNGTKVGPNTVSFTWPTGAEPTASIPEKYASKSDLKRDVKPGKQTMNFELTSK